MFELTGYPERDLMGRDLREALHLAPEGGDDPVATVLEWGVRQMGRPLVMRTRAGFEKHLTGDFFPAYDDDGGMLASIAPRMP